MGFEFEQISSYPRKVRLAILTLIAGWVMHFLFLYIYFKQLLDYRQLVIGVVICVFVAMINRWARMLCIFFNIVIVAIYVVLSQLFFSTDSALSGNTAYLLFVACCIVAFAASTFYLLTPECNQFFKAFGRTQDKGGASG